MKIIKSHFDSRAMRKDENIFDTENPDFLAPYHGETLHLLPLHHYHEQSDFSFLLRYFKHEHPIFENFSTSFYYILNQ